MSQKISGDYLSIDMALRRFILWYYVQSLAVYIMNIGLNRRRRDDRASYWRKIAEEMESGLKAYGHVVMRVRIDPNTFPDCAPPMARVRAVKDARGS